MMTPSLTEISRGTVPPNPVMSLPREVVLMICVPSCSVRRGELTAAVSACCLSGCPSHLPSRLTDTAVIMSRTENRLSICVICFVYLIVKSLYNVCQAYCAHCVQNPSPGARADSDTSSNLPC